MPPDRGIHRAGAAASPQPRDVQVLRVAQEERPDLLEKFGIDLTPTIVVLERQSIAARLESPRGSKEIERFLQPWLK